MVFEDLADLLANIAMIDAYDITPDLLLTSGQGIEPIDLAKLIIRAEKQFKVVIHDEYVLGFRRLGDLAAHIAQLMEENEEITPVKTDEEREAWYYG